MTHAQPDNIFLIPLNFIIQHTQCGFNTHNVDLWMLDTKATDRMHILRTTLSNITQLAKPIQVGFVEDRTTIVQQSGTIRQSNHITLHNVLLVSSFNVNLFFVKIGASMPISFSFISFHDAQSGGGVGGNK